jgi:hypothetical protein
MYGRPFGKSLCHAWGANPVYLFGKYVLGVKPLTPGYKTYVVEPSLAGLKWIKGRVPTPQGNIEVYADKKLMKIKSVEGEGILRLHSKKIPVTEKGVEVKKLGDDYYQIKLKNHNTEYSVKYW